LQAIATARRLGAVVRGYDIRPAAKQQVESLGATFVAPRLAQPTETRAGYAIDLSADAQQRERQHLLEVVSTSDVLITTALVPGRRAPILVTEDMVRAMTAGSVIVDAAADAGGNCELTQPGECIVRHGVTIVGAVNLPSSVPVHASQLYSRNVCSFIDHIVHNGELALDMNDVIVDECCVTRGGAIRHNLGKSTLSAHA
jgi:NAD(P) transhydrogenase subunit alpha